MIPGAADSAVATMPEFAIERFPRREYFGLTSEVEAHPLTPIETLLGGMDLYAFSTPPSAMVWNAVQGTEEEGGPSLAQDSQHGYVTVTGYDILVADTASQIQRTWWMQVASLPVAFFDGKFWFYCVPYYKFLAIGDTHVKRDASVPNVEGYFQDSEEFAHKSEGDYVAVSIPVGDGSADAIDFLWDDHPSVIRSTTTEPGVVFARFSIFGETVEVTALRYHFSYSISYKSDGSTGSGDAPMPSVAVGEPPVAEVMEKSYLDWDGVYDADTGSLNEG
jgi:hypothetical protein